MDSNLPQQTSTAAADDISATVASSQISDIKHIVNQISLNVPGQVHVGGPSKCFTVTGLKIRNTRDALTIFEACRRGILPRVVRRLNESEKEQISDGTVIVFDEREAKMKRWTDGRLWTPSRITSNFLMYRELERKLQPGEEGRREVEGWIKNSRSKAPTAYESNKGVFFTKPHGLMKRTISLTVPDNEEEFMARQPTHSARLANIHQQHLIAYFKAETQGELPAPEEMLELQEMRLPIPLLRIQKFRRPLKIQVEEGEQYSNDFKYSICESDTDDSSTNVAASTGEMVGKYSSSGSSAMYSSSPHPIQQTGNCDPPPQIPNYELYSPTAQPSQMPDMSLTASQYNIPPLSLYEHLPPISAAVGHPQPEQQPYYNYSGADLMSSPLFGHQSQYPAHMTNVPTSLATHIVPMDPMLMMPVNPASEQQQPECATVDNSNDTALQQFISPFDGGDAAYEYQQRSRAACVPMELNHPQSVVGIANEETPSHEKEL